jgi:hypothetical protein
MACSNLNKGSTMDERLLPGYSLGYARGFQYCSIKAMDAVEPLINILRNPPPVILKNSNFVEQLESQATVSQQPASVNSESNKQ